MYLRSLALLAFSGLLGQAPSLTAAVTFEDGFRAVRAGDFIAVRFAMANGLDVKAQDTQGFTLLMYASL